MPAGRPVPLTFGMLGIRTLPMMLGHASAAMTLDVYADLFDDDVDTVLAALDAARARAVVAN